MKFLQNKPAGTVVTVWDKPEEEDIVWVGELKDVTTQAVILAEGAYNWTEDSYADEDVEILHSTIQLAIKGTLNDWGW